MVSKTEVNVVYEEDITCDVIDQDGRPEAKTTPWKYQILWPNLLFFIYCHVAGVYGLYLFIAKATWTSVLLTNIFYVISAVGTATGAHRYFCHRSFKATLSLQIILMLCHSVAFQRSLALWIRHHRIHHKFSDTDADPTNARRGLFFSHIGWLLVKPHPEVERKGKLIDMSDVYSNPVIMFQKRNCNWLIPLMAFGLPTLIPWLLGETLAISWHLNILRFIVLSNVTFLGNSLAHTWGYKPYDKYMSAAQSLPLHILLMGEGFHNFHHAFPSDYRAGEISGNVINFQTKLIDLWAKLGLAYDLKTVSDDLVRMRMDRTGDGTDIWGNPTRLHPSNAQTRKKII